MTLVDNIAMHRGDSRVVRAYLRDDNYQLVDDSGAVYTLQARPTPGSDELLINTSSAQFAPGEGRLVIDPVHTEAFEYDRVLHYDVQVVESSGTVTTLQAGTITVLMDAAR
jgi:hypothetical protein